ncbi:MAG: glycosyltransferase [Bacteroidota bacterium]
MDGKKPKISLVTVTYNRAHLLKRSIESVLAQTYTNWELIIVDNGSIDHTVEVLKPYRAEKYQDKIKIFHLPENRNFAGGTNFGLEQISGEWFSLHDDDDEILPEALETMIAIPLEVDPEVSAVTCNCIDTTTKEFSGFGLEEEGYVSFKDIMTKASGEFWGITRSDLIGAKRLNEQILGYESIFWNEIDRIAKRYYLHKALRIWYTDHGSSLMKKSWSKDLELKSSTYRQLLEEPNFWKYLKEFTPGTYKKKVIRGIFFSTCVKDFSSAERYLEKLYPNPRSLNRKISTGLINYTPTNILKGLYKIIPSL